MRRVVIVSVVAIAALIGAAWYYLHGRQFVYRFTEPQIQQALAARLPIQKTYFFIVQVTFDNPQVTLLENSDRVRASLDVTLNIGLGDSLLPLGGVIEASGGIRYEPGEGRFYLSNPTVERLQVQGVPEKYAARVSAALTMALADYYSTRPIYTLDSVDARQAAAKLVLKSVVVEHKQLVVTLGIGS
jgi:hypothetical protein